MKRTHEGGDIIIEGKGSTEFGIGQALCFLAQSIETDSHRILPLSVHLEGEYGLSGINCGVPCRVGREGIESIEEYSLSADEMELLTASAEVIRKHTLMALEVAPL
jgi:L-lactate dehydrogenase